MAGICLSTSSTPSREACDPAICSIPAPADQLTDLAPPPACEDFQVIQITTRFPTQVRCATRTTREQELVNERLAALPREQATWLFPFSLGPWLVPEGVPWRVTRRQNIRAPNSRP